MSELEQILDAIHTTKGLDFLVAKHDIVYSDKEPWWSKIEFNNGEIKLTTEARGATAAEATMAAYAKFTNTVNFGVRPCKALAAPTPAKLDDEIPF